MDERFKYLLSQLVVEPDDENKIRVVLKDYEHLDYISDVLTEHFDISCDYIISDDENKKYILYFDVNAQEEVSSAINQINLYHKEHSIIYDTA